MTSEIQLPVQEAEPLSALLKKLNDVEQLLVEIKKDVHKALLQRVKDGEKKSDGVSEFATPAGILALRQRLECTQRRAAERVSVGLSTWQSWESGRNQPNSSALLKLQLLSEGKL